MRILVAGASGLVGGACLRAATEAGHKVAGTYHTHAVEGLVPLALESEEAIARLMESFAPEAVVCCTGWTWVDGCEADRDRAFRENCEQPARLARAAASFGAKVVYFSTSYVFDGREGPYSEDARPNPISVYGHAKLAGEHAVMDATAGSAIIARTMGVYGEEARRKNFVYEVRDQLSAGRRMRVPADQIGNASYTGDLAEAVLRLLAGDATGIWNLAGPEPCLSRKEFALRIAHEYGLDGTLFDFVSTAELHQPAARPLQGGLRIDRMRDELKMNPRDWVRIP